MVGTSSTTWKRLWKAAAVGSAHDGQDDPDWAASTWTAGGGCGSGGRWVVAIMRTAPPRRDGAYYPPAAPGTSAGGGRRAGDRAFPHMPSRGGGGARRV